MKRTPTRTRPHAGPRRTVPVVLCAAALAAIGCGGAADVQPRLRAAVDAKKPELERCYDVALGRNRDVGGEMKVVLAVAPSGGLDGVTVGASKVDDKDLVACVTSSLRTVRVDPAPPVDVKVEYTLRFHGVEPPPRDADPSSGGFQ